MKRHKQNRLKRLCSVLAVLLITFGMLSSSLVSAFAYECVDRRELSYSIIGIDEWSTHEFYVSDGSETYSALCCQPTYGPPSSGNTYSLETEYGSDDLVTKVWFYGCGGGQGSGPCSGLSKDGAMIITHHAIAYAEGDPGWNHNDQNALGYDYDTHYYYRMALDLVDYAASHSLPDGWTAWAKHLDSDDGALQDIVIYDEQYTHQETSNYGKVDVAKVSNSDGRELSGAIFGVFRYYADAVNAAWNGAGVYSVTGSWMDTRDGNISNGIIKTGSSNYGVTGKLFVGDDSDTSETYYVKELKAPVGYQVDTSIISVTVNKDQTTRVSNNGTGVSFANNPIKKRFQFSKNLYDSVTGAATPESGATFQIINSNGVVVETVTSVNGVVTTSPLDYGTYKVHQISGDKSAWFISDFNFTISYSDQTLVTGSTYSDLLTRIPATVALSNETGTQQGRVGEELDITDTVTIIHPVRNTTYKLKASLVNKDTGAVIVDGDGNEVRAEVTFVGSGEEYQNVPVRLHLNSTGLDGLTGVVFEELYIGDELICSEKKLDNESQQIYFASIGTKATDSVTGNNIGTVSETAKIIDEVRYNNLIVGQSYELRAVLMDTETGLPILDKNGNIITATKTFSPATKNGSEFVEITFDSNIVKGKDVTVFEDLYNNNKLVATHSDITSREQTVTYGHLKTFASDFDTQTKQGVVHENAKLVDKVSYLNLVVDKEYTVKGVLMDTETGLPILDKDGLEIRAEKTFTPTQKNGYVDVEFAFDSNLVKGKTIVVFEDLYQNGKKIGTHSDLTDRDQQVDYPYIGTLANDGISGDKYNNGAEEITLVDTVKYENLIVGKEYVIKGVLMDKSTGKALISKSTGKQITGETKFTATQTDGEIDVTFSLTRSDLVSRTVVVFEDLYQDEIEVFAHEDLNDEDQTIEYGTKLGIFKLDGTTNVKKVLSGATLQILDKDGNVVEIELITEKVDKDGKVTVVKEKVTSFVSTDEETIIANLEPGTYKLHEVKAPWGFNLAEDVEFTLKDMPELQHVVIVDEGKVGTMEFSYDEKQDYEVAADSAFVPSPKTGDASNMFMHIMMLIVSGFMLLALALGKHKKAIIKVFTIMAVFISIGMMSNSKVYADTTFTESQTFESENKDATYNFDETVKKNGEDFVLIGVKYDVAVKKIANVTKTNKVLATDAAPHFDETIVENGLAYKLKGTTKADANEMGNRAVNYTKAYTYNGITKIDSIPESVTEDIRDDATNEVRTVVMTRSDLVKSNEQISDNFAFNISVKSQAYFQYKDHMIEYDANDPCLLQYKDEILADLGLDSNIYTVESIKWTSEPVYDAQGFVNRTATVKGHKSIADYEATYVATVDYPTANVVYTAEYEADSTKNTAVYEIKATATYQSANEIAGSDNTVTEKSLSTSIIALFKNPVVVGSFTAVVLILIAVLGIILIKKKSEKDIVK